MNGDDIKPRPYLRLLLLAGLMGLLSAVITFAFMWIVHEVQVVMWDRVLGTEGPWAPLLTVIICVLALMLTSLLERELRRRGFDLSIRAILSKLAQIREVGAIYPDSKAKEPTIRLTLSQMSQEQRAMYDALDLERYRSAPA